MCQVVGICCRKLQDEAMLCSWHLQLTCCCRLPCSARLSQPGVAPALLSLFSAGAEQWSSAQLLQQSWCAMICNAASHILDGPLC